MQTKIAGQSLGQSLGQRAQSSNPLNSPTKALEEVGARLVMIRDRLVGVLSRMAECNTRAFGACEEIRHAQELVAPKAESTLTLLNNVCAHIDGEIDSIIKEMSKIETLV